MDLSTAGQALPEGTRRHVHLEELADARLDEVKVGEQAHVVAGDGEQLGARQLGSQGLGLRERDDVIRGAMNEEGGRLDPAGRTDEGGAGLDDIVACRAAFRPGDRRGSPGIRG